VAVIVEMRFGLHGEDCAPFNACAIEPSNCPTPAAGGSVADLRRSAGCSGLAGGLSGWPEVVPTREFPIGSIRQAGVRPILLELPLHRRPGGFECRQAEMAIDSEDDASGVRNETRSRARGKRRPARDRAAAECHAYALERFASLICARRREATS
jgi:hypothetical protein